MDIKFVCLWGIGLFIEFVIGLILEDSNKERIGLLWIAIIPSVILASGIPGGVIINCIKNTGLNIFFVFTLLIVIVLIIIEYFLMSLYNINNKKTLIKYACITVISIFIGVNYFSKVEVHTETIKEIEYVQLEENEDKIYNITGGEIKIEVFDDNQKPYLEIIKNITYRSFIDHNNGEKSTKIDKISYEYIFHLPEEVMEYGF